MHLSAALASCELSGVDLSMGKQFYDFEPHQDYDRCKMKHGALHKRSMLVCIKAAVMVRNINSMMTTAGYWWSWSAE